MCQGWASWRACVELSVWLCLCVRDGHRGAPVLSSACVCQGWASWRACVELSLCVRDGHRGAPVLSSVCACVSGMDIVVRLC